MTITLTPKEQDLAFKINLAATEINEPTFIIGGFVRDKILGRPCKDIDVVIAGDGILLAHGVASQFKIRPPVQFFKTYGTAQIKIGSTELEFVGARKESYSEDSRNPTVAPGTLADDQRRRDFTINALAIDVAEYPGPYTVIDPFNGLRDLDKGIIRTPVDPELTFSDDPLRMLRAIRFATQLGFTMDAECLEAIKRTAPRLCIITAERIATELNKIILAPQPSIGLKLLHEVRILENLLPELVALQGSQTIDNVGHKDNFYHSMQVLDNITPNTDKLYLRWAALLHDIGKSKVKKYEKDTGWTFHGHEFVSGKLLPNLFKRLRLPTNDALAYTRKIIELHHRPVSLTNENITDSAIRRLLFDAGEELDDLMTLCEADITSKNEKKKQRYLRNFETVRKRLVEVEESDKIKNWQPPISGTEIMELFGLSPSAIVGTLKDAIREAILDGVIPNEHEVALAYLVKVADGYDVRPV